MKCGCYCDIIFFFPISHCKVKGWAPKVWQTASKKNFMLKIEFIMLKYPRFFFLIVPNGGHQLRHWTGQGGGGPGRWGARVVVRWQQSFWFCSLALGPLCSKAKVNRVYWLVSGRAWRAHTFGDLEICRSKKNGPFWSGLDAAGVCEFLGSGSLDCLCITNLCFSLLQYSWNAALAERHCQG